MGEYAEETFDEYDEYDDDEQAINCSYCGSAECNNECIESKPVERITMAEVKYALNDYEFWPLSQIEVMEELKAYIEYLEANQKEKK